MATIKQIASQLNISISTVSRALNGKKGVSEALREKISALSKELGYYPDSNATALVNRKIGV
ncbi:MAG: LacI family DNA-binding transcriptional regulator, partial [Deltaproteobacteria bacterium]|nr:LacI family DNA-binding transcriptional regulator [Deltaproteobacteria bacterium]